jgi:hypothetical protein
MVVSSTSNRLANAASESLKATERRAENDIKISDDFLAFIKFIIYLKQLQEFVSWYAVQATLMEVIFCKRIIFTTLDYWC